MRGSVWKKQIKGVNEGCKVEEMDLTEIVQFLSEQNPADILCLGARMGAMADTLNSLEKDYPDKILQFLQPLIAVKDWKGKDHIIFVKPQDAMLSEKTLKTFVESEKKFHYVDMCEMFSFKYKEDVEKCYLRLETRQLTQKDSLPIDIKCTDGLIDLSPFIGIYQKAVFLDNYKIDEAIKLRIFLIVKMERLNFQHRAWLM